MSQEHVGTLREAFEAFGRHDMEAVAAMLDPEVIWEGVGELVPGGTSHRGVDDVLREVFATLDVAYEEFRAEPEEFIDAGERIVALGTFTVRPEGADRTVRTPFAEVAEFRDGRITRARWFTDTAEWLYAMPEGPPDPAQAEPANRTIQGYP
jgi:uncharacterized protein